MELTGLDWTFIIWYFVISIGIGMYYAKKAGSSISDYFISNRNIPWWIAGTSMVATTFAADTPLAVTGIVNGKNGIAGNWLWWCLALSGMLTVFVFAKLWRRSEVLTDIEFTELRYSGKPAAVLRGFRAVYLGILINCIIMGWVILGMSKVIEVTSTWPKFQTIVICTGITLLYTMASGYWGVVTTDFFQFLLAMICAIILAILAVSDIGGIGELKTRLVAIYGADHTKLNFLPAPNSDWWLLFFIYLAVLWWSTWYPGAEPGGGGYVAQRILSTRSEKDSVFATLWFNIAHYALRPWPWIVVALVALVYYPGLDDPELGYPKMMSRLLPVGLKGLMIASFLAAFMSTVNTHINWGASYLVNDLYKRFLKKDGSTKHYVLISRLLTILIVIVAGITAYIMQSIVGAWELLLLIGAGTGLVYLLRWFWWRINAWTEIAAMASAFVLAIVLWKLLKIDWSLCFIMNVGITTVIWLIVTFITQPTNKSTLLAFYNKIKPGGFWGPIAKEAESQDPTLRDFKSKYSLKKELFNWFLGVVMVYTMLFGIGKIILGDVLIGFIFLGLFVLAAIAIVWNFKKGILV
ncbi:MAG: sodium:solute symporter family protein [Planctomycetota bacterium]